MSLPLRLSPNERLLMHQLKLVSWAEDHASKESPINPKGLADRAEMQTPPPSWILTRDIELALWQADARDAWFAAGRSGTVKVVTGAGKTIAALAIVEKLQREDPELRVVIVVPTIVLMHQWVEVLRTQSNLPESTLARLGGGYSEDFDNKRRIMVAVLASARKELPEIVQRGAVGNHLLLIADECHRAGAPEMSAVLKTERRYSLGLSATPERDDDAQDGARGYADSVLGMQIGPIIYEMTFAQATELGLLPPFELHHLGLPLAPAEATQYERLTRSINDARKELTSASPAARKLGSDQLVAWARRASKRGQSSIAGPASRYVADTTRRKQLLYRADSRIAATRRLVLEALEFRRDARIILFHESIAEVIALFGYLKDDGIPVVMEHSDLPPDLREQTLDLFRLGIAQVVVSAKSLIEGFNVPEADLGIIVASSSSARQRIQSIGRVLRAHRGSDGQEKSSRVCVLYIRDSVDEHIYEREDWNKLVGLGRNRYFQWNPPDAPIEMGGPPRAVIPGEESIDLGLLNSGDIYLGRYEGAEFSTDSQGNVIDDSGRIALNPQGVPAIVKHLKGRAGRFRVTNQKAAVIARVPTNDEGWETLYGGILAEPFEFTLQQPALGDFTTVALAPGDKYPGPTAPVEELRFRQRRGGVVAKRLHQGEVFACGPNAERAVAILKELRRSQHPISKIYVNQLGHAFWYEDGVARYIADLENGLEFPVEA